MIVPNDDFDALIWQHQVAMHKKPSTRPTQEEIVKRSCTDKIRYASEKMAIMRGRVFLLRPRRQDRTKVLWTYPCEHCAGWHLTKRLSGYTRVEA
jgi:hypothetical protein